MYRRIGISLLLLSMWRTVFRPRHCGDYSSNGSNAPLDELKRLSHEAYWAVIRINVMWGIASIAVIHTILHAMPFSAPYLNFFFRAMTIPTLGMAYRFS